MSVLDEQDTPPLFTEVPPTTILDPKLKVGDVVLTVRAEDGDRGDPRDIRYFLTSDNELSQFFELLEGTGKHEVLVSLIFVEHTIGGSCDDYVAPKEQRTVQTMVAQNFSPT